MNKSKDTDVFQELCEIGSMIKSARLLNIVRTEVRKAVKNAQVMDGDHSSAGGHYDVVVVKCGADIDGLSRRLKANIPDVDVDCLVDGVLGIREKEEK